MLNVAWYYGVTLPHGGNIMVMLKWRNPDEYEKMNRLRTVSTIKNNMRNVMHHIVYWIDVQCKCQRILCIIFTCNVHSNLMLLRNKTHITVRDFEWNSMIQNIQNIKIFLSIRSPLCDSVNRAIITFILFGRRFPVRWPLVYITFIDLVSTW